VDSAEPVAPPAPEPVPEPPVVAVPARPLAAGERLTCLDLLRGIAILGILPANIPFFMGPTGFNPRAGATSWSDHLVIAGTLLVIDVKFITLLSIMFGAGLAIQFDRARAAGRPFTGYYLWRMTLLLGLGLAHMLLLWFGDILSSYAIVGMGALFLCRLGPKGLKWTTVGVLGWFYGLLFVVTAVLVALWATGTDLSALGGQAGDAPKSDWERRINDFFSRENELRIYLTGTFAEKVLHRAGWLAMYLVLFWAWLGWYILGCFLIGVALLRRGVFNDPQGQRPFVRRLVLVGLGVGIPLHVLGAALYLDNPESVLAGLPNQFGALPQALGYLGLVLLWSQTNALAGLQRRLQAVGQMSLTNYLMQTILCTTFFYGYGFGMFGRLDRAQGLLVVLTVWLLQLAWSPVWMKYFQMGPVEWAWRSLADGRVRPLRRPAPVAA
jgi:uncharacterized protein